MRRKLLALAVIVSALVRIVKLDYGGYRYDSDGNGRLMGLEGGGEKSEQRAVQMRNGTTRLIESLPVNDTTVAQYESPLARKSHHESYSGVYGKVTTIGAHSCHTSLSLPVTDESYEHDDGHDGHDSYEVVEVHDKDTGHGHGHGHGHKKKKKKKKKKKHGHNKKKKFTKIFKKRKKKKKHKKQQKYMKKFMMPMLIAYKLKFFTLIPVFVGKTLLYVMQAVMKNLSSATLYMLIQNVLAQLRMLMAIRSAMAT
jgi:hypothetical protein